MILPYRCTNPECAAITDVRELPATRVDPAESDHGDGCSGCGADLEQDALDIEPPEPDVQERFDRDPFEHGTY